jgi:hypothetical protein
MPGSIELGKIMAWHYLRATNQDDSSLRLNGERVCFHMKKHFYAP